MENQLPQIASTKEQQNELARNTISTGLSFVPVVGPILGFASKLVNIKGRTPVLDFGETNELVWSIMYEYVQRINDVFVKTGLVQYRSAFENKLLEITKYTRSWHPAEATSFWNNLVRADFNAGTLQWTIVGGLQWAVWRTSRANAQADLQGRVTRWHEEVYLRAVREWFATLPQTVQQQYAIQLKTLSSLSKVTVNASLTAAPVAAPSLQGEVEPKQAGVFSASTSKWFIALPVLAVVSYFFKGAK